MAQKTKMLFQKPKDFDARALLLFSLIWQK